MGCTPRNKKPSSRKLCSVMTMRTGLSSVHLVCWVTRPEGPFGFHFDSQACLSALLLGLGPGRHCERRTLVLLSKKFLPLFVTRLFRAQAACGPHLLHGLVWHDLP